MSGAAYRARMMRPDWPPLAERIKRRAGGRCERCKVVARLEVHHLTYERLGCEADADLLALCPPCHREADRERERQTASRRFERAAAEEQAREDAAFSTWLERRHGDTDADDLDYERERFDAWRARKEESEDYA